MQSLYTNFIGIDIGKSEFVSTKKVMIRQNVIRIIAAGFKNS